MATNWSVVTEDGFPNQMAELIDGMQLGDYIQDAREEAQAKLDAAKLAAKDLVARECVGLDRSIFRVGISGRSNPGHAPDQPHTYEMISIVLYEIAQMPIAAQSGAPEPEPAPTPAKSAKAED